jgi:hypothetical protein
MELVMDSKGWHKVGAKFQHFLIAFWSANQTFFFWINLVCWLEHSKMAKKMYLIGLLVAKFLQLKKKNC